MHCTKAPWQGACLPRSSHLGRTPVVPRTWGAPPRVRAAQPSRAHVRVQCVASPGAGDKKTSQSSVRCYNLWRGVRERVGVVCLDLDADGATVCAEALTEAAKKLEVTEADVLIEKLVLKGKSASPAEVATQTVEQLGAGEIYVLADAPLVATRRLTKRLDKVENELAGTRDELTLSKSVLQDISARYVAECVRKVCLKLPLEGFFAMPEGLDWNAETYKRALPTNNDVTLTREQLRLTRFGYDSLQEAGNDQSHKMAPLQAAQGINSRTDDLREPLSAMFKFVFGKTPTEVLNARRWPPA